VCLLGHTVLMVWLPRWSCQPPPRGHTSRDSSAVAKGLERACVGMWRCGMEGKVCVNCVKVRPRFSKWAPHNSIHRTRITTETQATDKREL